MSEPKEGMSIFTRWCLGAREILEVHGVTTRDLPTATEYYDRQYTNDLAHRIAAVLADWPASAPEKTALMLAEKKVTDAAARGDLVAAARLIDSEDLAGKLDAAVPLKQAFVRARTKYEQALPGAELKVTTLRDHPENAAIAVEFGRVAGYLSAAKNLVKAPTYNYEDAGAEIGKIDSEFGDAKQIADNTRLARDLAQQRRTMIDKFRKSVSEHQGGAAVSAQALDGLDLLHADLMSKIGARQWTAFNALFKQISDDIEACRAKAHELGAWRGILANSQTLVAALELHPNKAAISTEIAALKNDFLAKARDEYENKNNPNAAHALLEQVEGKYRQAKAKADDAGKLAYESPRDEVRRLVAALKTPVEKAALLGAEIAALEAKLVRAEKYAGKLQYAAALAMVAEAKAECEAAEKAAAAQLALDLQAREAEAAAAKTATDPQAAIAAVQKLYDALDKHAGRPAIVEDLKDIKSRLEEARSLAA